MRKVSRYLGLELAGAKNQKTSLAALEYYPNEKKIFLLDIFDKISTLEDQSGDEAVLEAIHELTEDGQMAKMGVNVALELPPCITCTRKTCPLPSNCDVPAVNWMKNLTQNVSLSDDSSIRVKEFTPYTQRPIELWMKYEVLSKLPEKHSFDIDETLGGNRAPLSARMHFLKRQLSDIPLVEVSPKLTTAILSNRMNLHPRIYSTYRHLENGAYSREQFLTQLSKQTEIFIYERDMRKLTQHLTAFDAFICAFTALLADQDLCVKPPSEFPLSSGWIHYPVLDPTS